MSEIISFKQAKFARDSLRVTNALMKHDENMRIIMLMALTDSLTDEDKRTIQGSIPLDKLHCLVEGE